MTGWTMSTSAIRKARKDYPCDACGTINAWGLSARDFEPSEWAAIQAAGGKILRGEKYVCCSGIFDGEWTTFRARPEIDKICQDGELYDE